MGLFTNDARPAWLWISGGITFSPSERDYHTPRREMTEEQRERAKQRDRRSKLKRRGSGVHQASHAGFYRGA